MGGRALSPEEWAPNLREIFREEIAKRVVDHSIEAERRVATAHQAGVLLGLAYVSFNLSARVPFVILEDIVVESSQRGGGVGQTMLEWIFERAKQAGAKRIFLESGTNNHAAHSFFARNRFRAISVVMMADLTVQ